MMINVAGPFTSPTEAGRLANRRRIDAAAAAVLLRGHIPIVGANSAGPLVAHLPEEERYEAMMEISLALLAKCDAILHLASSPGADRERALAEELGLIVYGRVDDVPFAAGQASR